MGMPGTSLAMAAATSQSLAMEGVLVLIITISGEIGDVLLQHLPAHAPPDIHQRHLVTGFLQIAGGETQPDGIIDGAGAREHWGCGLPG